MSRIIPVDFEQANKKLTGRTPDVSDLLVHDNGTSVMSCWKIPFWARIKIVFTGKIFLAIKGKTHPPVCLYAEAE